MIKNEPPRDPFFILNPFNDDLWVTITFSIIFYGIALFLTARLGSWRRRGGDAPEREPPPPSLAQSIVIIWHSFLQQEGEFQPRVIGERVIVVTWRVYSLIIIATYTANFAAFLSNSYKSKDVQTFEDLLNNDDELKYGVEINTSNYDFFRYTDNVEYQEAFRKMEEWGTIYPPADIPEGIERISTTTALITDEISVSLLRSQNCDKEIVSLKPINFEEQAFAMRMDLPQAPDINKAIRRYGRSGMLVLDSWPACERKDPDHAVGVDKLSGFFIIMSVAAICALATPWIVSWRITRMKINKYFSAK